MARMRTLKPGFFTNDLLAEIEPLGRLLFQGLWCLADREGRLEDRPRRIKAEVLPYDEADVDGMLFALADLGFITRYEVDGNHYIQVVNFGKHQTPHVKEAASTIPAPCKPDASIGLAPTKDSASTPSSGIRDLGSGELDLGSGSQQLDPTPSKPTAAAAATRASAREAVVTVAPVVSVDSGGSGGDMPAESENKKAVKRQEATPAPTPTERWLAEIIPRATVAVNLKPANPDALRAVLAPYHARDADTVVAELFACQAFYEQKGRKLDVRLINNWLKDWIEREKQAHAQEQAAAAAAGGAGGASADSGGVGAGSGPRGAPAYSPSPARYSRNGNHGNHGYAAAVTPDPTRQAAIDAMFQRGKRPERPERAANSHAATG